MRISDWSSDVCSSDLSPSRRPRKRMSGFCVIAGEIAIAMLHLIEDSRRGTLNQPSRSALRDLSVHHPSTSRHATSWASPTYRKEPRPKCGSCPPPSPSGRTTEREKRGQTGEIGGG